MYRNVQNKKEYPYTGPWPDQFFRWGKANFFWGGGIIYKNNVFLIFLIFLGGPFVVTGLPVYFI